jgi:hypothetical protein
MNKFIRQTNDRGETKKRKKNAKEKMKYLHYMRVFYEQDEISIPFYYGSKVKTQQRARLTPLFPLNLHA